MTTPILGMGELAAHSPELGNKVKNLAALAQAGVRVPRGFGLPYSVYSDYIAGLLPELEKAREGAGDYSDMTKRLHEIVVSAPFSGMSDVLAALEEHVAGASYFAVRSSGAPVIGGQEAAEDSAGLSLAGQYESFLLVPAHNVPQAILWCYASLFSERCLRQFKVQEDGRYLKSRMSVLVQEMCLADLSAVVMTRDPVEGGDVFGVEVTYGACEALVSGEVQGDLHLLSRTSGAVLSAEMGTKTTQIGYKPLDNLEVNNKFKVALPPEQRMRYAASGSLIAEIYDLSMGIERHFGAPQDIELVVAGGEIIVTQARPITASK
ncbi:MAG TPA: PEP/pyruvate-binding domain-containing protein [Candidatus Saccharimonadales bacterium]